MGHLGELRRRITYIAIVVVICMIVAFIEKKWVFFVLLRPLKDTQVHQLTTLGVTEAFMNVLKVSIYAGLIISLPFIIYQFWAFIMPALYENEKRSTVPYVLSTTALFLAGVAFGYFIVLPVGLRFMIGYGGDLFNQLLQAERYINFVSMFLLAFGLVFLLPLVMMLLSWAGIVNHQKMKKVRKYAILVEAIVAMVFTPSQDPVSMALMLIPLILLYEFGIWLARLAQKRKDKRDQLAVVSES
ncbi:MAG: twin-arginine translocase subunit TatC [Thermoleophilia bacterium]